MRMIGWKKRGMDDSRGAGAGSIRILTADDAAAYQALRLHALRGSPSAFASTCAAEVNVPLSGVAQRLARDAGGETWCSARPMTAGRWWAWPA